MTPYTLTTELTILQQAEYDVSLWRRWRSTKRSQKDIDRLNQLQPEKQTLKYRYLLRISQVLGLILPQRYAIELALWDWQWTERLLTFLILTAAKWRLKRRRQKGLQVIAVAGSYGKTSVKHTLHHVLSHRFSCLMTPASYNTPLGIALTIWRQLQADHQFFIVELGEYQAGDLEPLLSWLKPNLAVLTPLGSNHSERWQSPEEALTIFAPLWSGPYAPAKLLSADVNKASLPGDVSATWYGSDPENQVTLKSIVHKITGSQAQLVTPDGSCTLNCRLLGAAHLENFLPALIIANTLGYAYEKSCQTLAYAPDIPRRLQVQETANATLIDNSYNTSPGAWQESMALLKKRKLPDVVVVTGGFVEIAEPLNTQAHEQMAEDLLTIATAVVLIRSRYNAKLRSILAANTKIPVVEVDTYPEALQAVTDLDRPLQYLWLEGGMREIYQ